MSTDGSGRPPGGQRWAPYPSQVRAPGQAYPDSNPHAGHRERLRARFRDHGPAALSDHELLELLLFFVIPKRDTKPTAKALLKRFDGWARLLAPRAPTREVPGCGPCTAMLLEVVGAIVERRIKQPALGERLTIESIPKLVQYLGAAMHGLPLEQVHVLYVDQANNILADETLSRGTEEQAAVYPRQIMRRALAHHATGVILAHNHPAGTIQPSAADREITRAVAAAARTLDIRFLDHVILGVDAAGYFSFREAGLL